MSTRQKYAQVTAAGPLLEQEYRHSDKEEVPGSSPGNPTTHFPVIRNPSAGFRAGAACAQAAQDGRSALLSCGTPAVGGISIRRPDFIEVEGSSL
jgi:hypothetical protein